MEKRASDIEVKDTEVNKAMEEIYEKWESTEDKLLKWKGEHEEKT